jgi:hypothetical protein
MDMPADSVANTTSPSAAIEAEAEVEVDPTASQLPSAILDVGPHTRTFEGVARGYWFTAPDAFTITGVRVPTAASAEAQTAMIVKFPGIPPETNTRIYTILGSWQGIEGSGVIPANIPVAAGDVIGVLGQRDNTHAMTSYGHSPYQTEIAGNSVVLHRLLAQFNLYGIPTPLLRQASQPELGRVELYYR